MAIDVFHDLEVHIGAHRVGQGYPVQLILDRVRVFPSGVMDAEVASWRPTGDPAEDGRRLLACLLADDPARDSWREAKGAAPQRRVRIRIDAEAAELHALPWELLRDEGRALAADAHTPFSRFVPSDQPVHTRPTRRPVRLLVAIANPQGLNERGLVELDFEAQAAAIQDALRDFPHVEAEILPPPTTLAAIESALQGATAAPYTVLHIVAHGERRPAGGAAGLLLETAERQLDWVSEDRLGDMLAGLHAPLDCIVLMACHTAGYQAGGQLAGGALRGIAPRLLGAGIPAVVAMQGEVTTASAGRFAASFYRQLAGHGVLDLAVNEARHALQTGQRPDAAVPVLISRLPTGQLWDLPPRRDFYRHVPLPAPERYVARTEALDAIRAALLSGEGARGLALHGMPGAGKSVLARVLCEDPEVRVAFPDGILWATLGRDADVPTRLREWLSALGAPTAPNGPAPSLAQLQNALAEQLCDRACLLVLDDVWRRADAAPFVTAMTAADPGGAPRRPGPRLLITTRDAAVARELALDIHTVEPLSMAEAQSLLARWGGETVTTASDELQARVASRLGRLPLALRLAGAQLSRTRMDLSDWLEAFDAQKLRSLRPESDQDNLFDTLSLSLADLPATVRQAFKNLAIFREGEPIPIGVVTKLWQTQAALDHEALDDLACRERLQDFLDRALIEPGAHADEIRLHALMRDFAMTPLGSEGLRGAHRLLLRTYARDVDIVRWSEIPDDGYLHAHLAYHLDRGGSRDAVDQLFQDDTWLRARVASRDGRYDGYLDDLELARMRADEQVRVQFEASASLTALADALRYALIRASINSLATQTPPPLIAEAVAHRVWTVRRVLSVARRMPLSQRVRALHRLLMAVPPDAEGQEAAAEAALDAIRGLDNDPFEGAAQRAQALAAIAPYLDPARLHQALDLAQTLPTLHLRAEALAGVIPHLEPDLQARVQATTLSEIAAAVGPETGEAAPPRSPRMAPSALGYALTALAPGLTPDYLCQALAIACTLPDDWERGEAVRRLIPALSASYDSPDALLRALDTTCLIEGSYVLARVLTALVGYVTTRPDAARYMKRILAKALRLDGERDRAVVLAALAPHLDDAQIERALQAARGFLDAPARVKALAALAHRLPDGQRQILLEELLSTVTRMAWELDRMEALADLAPALPPDMAEQVALDPALIGPSSDQPTLWAELAPYLPEGMLPAALDRAASAERPDVQGRLLDGLIPRLPEHLLPQAAAVIRGIGDPAARAKGLGTLAIRCEGAERSATLGEALEAVAALRYELDRADALVALAPKLSGPLIRQAMPLALALTQPEARSRAVAMLASRLPTLPDAAEYLAHLLEPEQIPDQASQAAAFLALLPETGPDARTPLVEALLALVTDPNANRVFDGAARTELLSQVAPYCTERLSTPMAEALEQLPDDADRCAVLCALPLGIRGKVQALKEKLASRLMRDPDAVNALLALVPRLPAGSRRRALRTAMANARLVDSPYDAALAWAAIAGQVSWHDGWRARARAVTAASDALEAIEDPYLRLLATTALLPELAGKQRAELLETTVDLARDPDIDDYGLWADALTELLPFLESEAYREIAATALVAAGEIDIVDEDRPEQALVALAPQLGPQHLAEALIITREFTTERARSRALIALIPLLRAAPDLSDEVFELAHALEDPIMRFRTDVALIPYAPDGAAHLMDIRLRLAEAIRASGKAQRADVLRLIAESDAFTPDILGITQADFDAMALAIKQISTQWAWM